MRASGVIVVLVNTGSKEQAIAIANTLVKERLASCANIISPVRSIYRWKDAVQDETEHTMIIKTRASLFVKLERRVKQLHSYEVPEIVAVPIVAGAKDYLDWIVEATAGARRGKR